jgi:hypothetical protein
MEDYDHILKSLANEYDQRMAQASQKMLHRLTVHLLQTCLEAPQYHMSLDTAMHSTTSEIHEQNGLGGFTVQNVMDEYYRFWGES